jgi:iron complex transport system ATP-binding protein
LTPVLEVQDLTVGYRDKPVLSQVSFQIDPQQFVAVIGPNGCGKTTLIKTIMKSLPPDSGSIRILGRDLNQMSSRDLARCMSAVLQIIDPAAMTVKDYVVLGRMPFFRQYQFFETRADLEIAWQYMELTGVAHLADQRITQISGGERQLCAIARALTQEPSLLVLDEPTAHLDITHQKSILDLITRLKTQLSLTVLMVLHDLNLAAEYADHLVMLSRETPSVFSAGTPDQVLTQDHIQHVYHTRVKVRPNPLTRKPWILLINDNPSHSP